MNKIPNDVFTGVLSGAKAARLMSGDAAAFCPKLEDPIQTLTQAVKDSYRKKSNLSRAAYSNFKYLVTVKNMTTNEQYTYPKALDNLDDWKVHFLDKSIFRDINPIEDAEVLPELRPPSPKDPTTFVCWTSSEIKINKYLYHIITTLAPISYESKENESTYDIVTLYACSPKLPLQNKTFREKYVTSEQKRICTIHCGCIAHAKTMGFEESTLQPQSNSVTKDKFMTTTQLRGQIASHVREDKAGSVVIPHVLKYLSFLLPVLDVSYDITYDIIQPHKSAYIFQIRNLSSGWRILGCVNLFHPSSELVRIKFDEEKRLKKYDEAYYALFTSKTAAAAIQMSSCSMTLIERFLTETNQVLKKIKPDYINEMNAFYNANTILPINAFDPFYDAIKDVFLDINEVKNVTEDDRDILNKETFTLYLQYLGLEHIMSDLRLMWKITKRKQDIALGDAFISNLEAAYNNIKRSSNNSNNNNNNNNTTITIETLTPQQIITAVFPVLFQVCVGLAEQIMKKLKIINKLIIPHLSNKKLIKNHFLSQNNNENHNISPKKLISFLTKSCRGIPPKEWLNLACDNIIADPFDFALLLHTNPDAMAVFLPEEYWGVTKTEFKDFINNNIMQFDNQIHEAWEYYLAGFSKELKTSHAKLALAFLLFSNDPEEAIQWY